MSGRVSLALPLLLVACRGPAEDTAPRAAESALCEPVLPAMRYGYSDADAPIPRHLLASFPGTVAFTDNTPPENPITNAGATLGRVLFYDVRLSANDRIACASCHQQAFGFGDTARFSPGLSGRHPARRTMALANARFYAYGKFFWDERASSLEAQILHPIQDTLEMGMELDALARKLGATPYYPALFTAAFGSPEVTSDGIAFALAQFVRSLVSAESRFDAVFATGGAPNYSLLSEQEREGLRIFNDAGDAGCVNCHRTIAQVADKANNIGLDIISADTGAGGGRFKPPSLRNAAVRPPYMHDGRFATLREVVEFYDSGIEDSPDLDPRLRASDGSPRRLHLGPAQRAALVAFLNALTDPAFLTAERFSNPFPCRSAMTRRVAQLPISLKGTN
jgi:cytochrome c peroxidase